MLRSQITALTGGAIFNRVVSFRRLKIAEPDPEVEKLRMQFYSIRKKYMKAYDDLLAQNTDRTIDLNKPELSEIIADALAFWEGNRIENFA